MIIVLSQIQNYFKKIYIYTYWTPLQRAHCKSFLTLVFFKLLNRFWCLKLREFRQKAIGEVIEWVLRD